ncbi:MAG: hypothetical protein ACXADB_00945 [Candidatus Hermodarchaeia archaeon]|jgi:F0F1-type ATP synthase membrane subunit c/vacuolar-type H+-ATPase subunit K
MRKHIFFILLIALISLLDFGVFIGPQLCFAQLSSSGIAMSIPIADDDAGDGDIICSYSDGVKRCQDLHDPAMYGVVSDNPAASIVDTDIANSRLVITSGIASVRVSSVNGNIAEGDFVTSSEILGVGQAVSRNGYVLGTAIEDYRSDNPDDIGKIQVMINIHPAAGLSRPSNNLLQFIREGITVPLFEPLESLRYLLAVLMILISFTLGMIYFGRSSRTGIEAVGRNPLARRVIQFTVVMNIVLTIVIVLVGLTIAYLILVL